MARCHRRDRKGARIESITYLVRNNAGTLEETFEEHTIFADRFVLAAGAMMTPMILHWSGSTRRGRCNFMHNAFMITPVTTKYGHVPWVLDPYTLTGWGTHPARIQKVGTFIDGSTCGGAEHNTSTVSKQSEARRAQKCVDGNADWSECKVIYTCLKEEYTNIKNNCR